jgi:hypothetical protein
MLIECQSSNVCSDIRCAICGQGFLMYSEAAIRHQRVEIRSLVQHVLREHHTSDQHPNDPFTVEWNESTAARVVI